MKRLLDAARRVTTNAILSVHIVWAVRLLPLHIGPTDRTLPVVGIGCGFLGFL